MKTRPPKSWWRFAIAENAVCHVVLGVVANGGGSKSVKADGVITITPAYPRRTTQHTCIGRCNFAGLSDYSLSGYGVAKMKVLHLTLKKKWFDMIASGAKKEEYREIKPYWNQRLHTESFDVVAFRNGYGKHVPSVTVELLGIERGLGIVEWGAPEKTMVYILKLGRIITA